jgi:hypothetical protein
MLLDPISDMTARSNRSLIQILQEGIQTLFHLMLFSLLALGLGGLIYKAVRPDGWIGNTLSQLWSQHPVATIVVCALGLAGAGFGTRLFERLPLFGKRGDMLVYCCLALGLFFAFKLIVTGSL